MEFATLLIFWISFAMMIGALAESWNRSALIWRLSALIAIPLLRLAYSMVAGNATPRSPACRGYTYPGARICRLCGHELELMQASAQ
ncbi:MAG: hypothetical protein EA339_10980 [Rhodobacteraceae bacterium]|nr:MAG: hypothetical protein EA339_10980 [Paracoccaceae bacterium]